MFGINWKSFKFSSSSRNIHCSAINREKDVTARETVNKIDVNYLDSVPLRPFDKKLFVWSGKYKRIEDVPDRASRSAVAKAQSVCRIKTCNYMMVAVIIAAGVYIMLGKRDSERGMTIGKMNQEWHRQYNQRFEEQEKQLKQ